MTQHGWMNPAFLFVGGIRVKCAITPSGSNLPVATGSPHSCGRLPPMRDRTCFRDATRIS